jgi:hypothetical protein
LLVLHIFMETTSGTDLKADRPALLRGSLLPSQIVVILGPFRYLCSTSRRDKSKENGQYCATAVLEST